MLTSENLDVIDTSASLPRKGVGVRPIRKKSIKSRIVEVIKNLVGQQY
jgi:hypothetical protein